MSDNPSVDKSIKTMKLQANYTQITQVLKYFKYYESKQNCLQFHVFRSLTDDFFGLQPREISKFILKL